MNAMHRRAPRIKTLPMVLAMTVIVILGAGGDCDDSMHLRTGPQAANRAHYFDGRLLTADDLTQEQDYDRDP